MDSSLSYVELLSKLRRVFWSLLHAYSLSRASQKQLIFPGVKLSWTWPLAMGTSFRDPDCGFNPQVLWVNGLGEWGCGRIFGLSTCIRFLPLALRAKFPSIPVITPLPPTCLSRRKASPKPRRGSCVATPDTDMRLNKDQFYFRKGVWWNFYKRSSLFWEICRRDYPFCF